MQKCKKRKKHKVQKYKNHLSASYYYKKKNRVNTKDQKIQKKRKKCKNTKKSKKKQKSKKSKKKSRQLLVLEYLFEKNHLFFIFSSIGSLYKSTQVFSFFHTFTLSEIN